MGEVLRAPLSRFAHGLRIDRSIQESDCGVMSLSPVVYVVDDDLSFRQSVSLAIERLGLRAETFATADAFTSFITRAHRGCVVLDHHLPDMTGLQVQQSLRRKRITLPIIFVSGHANVTLAVEAMRRGAVTVLEKPVSLHHLVEQIFHAFEVDRQRHAERLQRERAAERLQRLTEKERQVVELLIAGRTNKQMAAQLGLTLRAIEDRRARVMRKLEVQSLAEIVMLVRDAEASLPPAPPRAASPSC